MELAEEYGIVPWIAGLLDNAPISEIKNPDEPKKSIYPPPKFVFRANDDDTPLPPINLTARSATPRARGRPRASSPSKNGASTSKMASPRKPRARKASNATSATNAASAREASATLQSTLDTAASIADTDSIDGGDKGTIEIDTAVQVNGDVEITTTNLKIEMPGGSAEFPPPEDPEQMIEKAKEMVKEARKLDGQLVEDVKSLKRKAEELEDDDEDDEKVTHDLQPAKKARLLEHQLKKEKVRNRALLGVAATLAIGYVLPLYPHAYPSLSNSSAQCNYPLFYLIRVTRSGRRSMRLWDRASSVGRYYKYHGRLFIGPLFTVVTCNSRRRRQVLQWRRDVKFQIVTGTSILYLPSVLLNCHPNIPLTCPFFILLPFLSHDWALGWRFDVGKVDKGEFTTRTCLSIVDGVVSFYHSKEGEQEGVLFSDKSKFSGAGLCFFPLEILNTC